MAKAATILLAAGVISVSSAPLAGAQHTHDELHTIAIMVVNEAAVSEDLLEHAQGQATRIYEPTGVALNWTDSMIVGPTPPPRVALRLTIKIVPHSKLGHGEDAMGFALKGGNLAYVFYGRVTDFAEQHQIDTATVLGHVIAHEMGHLLLPNMPHSSNGIMRANWHRAYQLAIMRSRSGLSFTSAEAEVMRQSLETRWHARQ